jgi:hypothetical protein
MTAPRAHREFDTPPAVTAAVAASVAPLPFLAFYAAIFLAHGTVFPTEQPDVTDSLLGETIAGVVALVLFVFLVVGSYRFLSGRGRWAFLLGQAIVVAAMCWFLADSTSGDRQVPIFLLLTSLVALGFWAAPASRACVDDRLGRRQAGRTARPRRRRARRHESGTVSVVDLRSQILGPDATGPGGPRSSGPGLSPGTVSEDPARQ